MKLYDGGFLFLLTVLVFGYGVSILERSSDENNKFDKEIAKEVIDSDIDKVTDTASEAWANRKPLDYSKLNK